MGREMDLCSTCDIRGKKGISVNGIKWCGVWRMGVLGGSYNCPWGRLTEKASSEQRRKEVRE